MMSDRFSRAKMLLGDENIKRLSKARVAVFGLGGVGGYAAEALARSGVGALDLIDNDVVSMTNINRQIYALQSTLGRYKTDVARERILDINPDCTVRTHTLFYAQKTADEIELSEFDCIIDAIDTVTAKIELIVRASEKGVQIVSSMGAGNKLDPSAFEAADIYDTSVCPLAKVMRKELRKRGIERLRVVYSKEKPIKASETDEQTNRRSLPGSSAFAPPAAGLILAAEAVKALIETP